MICIFAVTFVAYASDVDVAAVVAAYNDVVVAATFAVAADVAAPNDVASASNASAASIPNLCSYVAACILSFCLEILLLHPQTYILMLH